MSKERHDWRIYCYKDENGNKQYEKVRSGEKIWEALGIDRRTPVEFKAELYGVKEADAALVCCVLDPEWW